MISSSEVERRSVRITIVAASALALGVVVALVALPLWIGARIDAEARARGYVCTFGARTVGFFSIDVKDAACTLADVKDVEMKIESMSVALVGLSPGNVDMDGLAMTARGEEVLFDLARWLDAHGAAQDVAISATRFSVTWTHPATKTPLVDAKGTLHIARAGDDERARFEGTVALAGAALPLRAITLVHKGRQTTLELGDKSDPLTGMLVLSTTAPAKATLTAQLGKAKADLAAPIVAKEGAPIEATLHVDAQGFVPPHAKELDAILHGKSTKVDARVVVPADRKRVEIDDIVADAAGVPLRGSGTIDEGKRGARITLRLKGSVACTALASSAATADLGALAPLASAMAKRSLSGNVGVTISVDGDLADMERAAIDTHADVGCKAEL